MKYTIGDLVKVKAVSFFVYLYETKDELLIKLNGNRAIIREQVEEDLIGIICGASYKKTGMHKKYTRIQRAIMLSPEYLDGKNHIFPTYLKIRATYLVYHVRLGMLNKPILVWENDLEIHKDENFKLPELTSIKNIPENPGKKRIKKLKQKFLSNKNIEVPKSFDPLLFHDYHTLSNFKLDANIS